jgi:Tfp pilus assembly protein PilF
MSRRRTDDELAAIDRVLELLAEAPPGLHDVGPPATTFQASWPDKLRELYAACDGARLFHESIELVPAADVVERSALDGRSDFGRDRRWRIGSWDGDDVWVDARGRVLRHDPSVDDLIVDGTAPDRWLAGAVDACGLMFDPEGEYYEDVFDRDGELAPETAERRDRAQLKRDPRAPGPRWRLARHLLARGDIESARDELEDVVAAAPDLAWAWLDLSRVSESLGELDNAVDEATAAAEGAPDSPYVGFAWAQVARLEARRGNDGARARAAARALAAAPDLKTAQLDGARSSIAAGDLDSARGIVDLLRALAPRDIDVLALARQLES